MKRKGQLRIQQMAVMLLALVLLFVIVLLIFLSISLSGLKKEVTRLNKEEAISTAVRLAGTAEFSCGKDYCIDTDKLIVLKNMQNYENFWQVQSIEIRRLTGNTECSLENYPNCDVFTILDKSSSDNSLDIIYIDTFVSLCRKESENGYPYDKCEVGKLLIGYKKER